MLAFLASPRVHWSRPVHLIALSQSFLVDLGPLGAMRQGRVLLGTELREQVFQLDVLKAHLGVRALHACVLNLHQGVLEPPRTSDCTIVVVSVGLGTN